MDLFYDLLTLQSEEFQIILAYDTTLQLGDFYVSPILFHHIYFQGSPIIPLVHDQKFQVSHEKMFSKLAKKIPNLKKKKVPLIAEGERGINNAIKLYPNLCPIFCWNHICQDVKHWVQTHNGTSDDTHAYIDHVLQLLKSENPDEFEENYQVIFLQMEQGISRIF